MDYSISTPSGAVKTANRLAVNIVTFVYTNSQGMNSKQHRKLYHQGTKTQTACFVPWCLGGKSIV
jgi:hypothetical protein